MSSALFTTPQWSRSRQRSKTSKTTPRATFKPPRPSETNQTLPDDQQTQNPEEPLLTPKDEPTSKSCSSTDELDSCSIDEIPEDSYRAIIRTMLNEHGLELSKAWFNLEAMTCKKPKLEHKKK